MAVMAFVKVRPGKEVEGMWAALLYLCLALGLASAAPDFSGESDAVEPPRLIGPPLDLRIPAQSALDVQVEHLTINKRGEVVEVQDLPLRRLVMIVCTSLTFDVFTGGTDGQALAVRVPLQLELSSRRLRAQVVWQVFQEGRRDVLVTRELGSIPTSLKLLQQRPVRMVE